MGQTTGNLRISLKPSRENRQLGEITLPLFTYRLPSEQEAGPLPNVMNMGKLRSTAASQKGR